MTASVDDLGVLHQMQAQVMKRLLEPREEPVLTRDGEPVLLPSGEPMTRTVYPTAAELAAVNTFLKSNNITAVSGNQGALDELESLMKERQANKRKGPLGPAWTPPDVGAVEPNPDTPWQ